MTDLVDYLEIEHIYSQTLGKQLRSVAICAANSGEGTSTLACALAERHQRSGKRTLLVDMNFFRPSLDIRYNLPRENWNSGNQSFSKAIINDISGIDVLTASTTEAVDFRQGDAIEQMISRWEAEYDAIVIDTSPLNAINRHNIPAELVCARVQVTVMIVRSAITTETDILNAAAKLKSQNANLLGVVMNDVDCPTLAQELIRESNRLHKFLPKVANWLVKKIKHNHFLNTPI